MVFKNLTQMAQMLRGATQISHRVSQWKVKLANHRVRHTSPDGSVSLVITGLGKVESVSLAPHLMQLDHHEHLQKEIAAAMNEGLKEVRQLHVDAFRELTGGMDIPGMSDILDTLKDE